MVKYLIQSFTVSVRAGVLIQVVWLLMCSMVKFKIYYGKMLNCVSMNKNSDLLERVAVFSIGFLKEIN